MREKKAGVDLKRKTIKAVLRKKTNEFLESITDPEVKKLLKDNLIISGGCIVSMLRGEKVNDFDYYYTNKETCLAATNYYVAKFNERTGRSVSVKDEDGRIKIFVKGQGVAGDETQVPEDEPTTEFDDMGMEDLTLSEIKEEVKTDSYRPIFLSTNAISLSNKVQLITRFYGDAEEIHTNYDFVHCTCYWTSEDNNLVLPASALESIITRELVYIGSKYPLCSIMRAKKFVQRGWQINAGQFVKMALQLNEMDLLDVNILEDQLTGVDSAYFLHVIDIIKEKQENNPDFKLDNNYLFTVINRIFKEDK